MEQKRIGTSHASIDKIAFNNFTTDPDCIIPVLF